MATPYVEELVPNGTIPFGSTWPTRPGHPAIAFTGVGEAWHLILPDFEGFLSRAGILRICKIVLSAAL